MRQRGETIPDLHRAHLPPDPQSGASPLDLPEAARGGTGAGMAGLQERPVGTQLAPSGRLKPAKVQITRAVVDSPPSIGHEAEMGRRCSGAAVPP